MSAWLSKYYGPKWKKILSPVVQYEGKNKAIVRVQDDDSFGFVLVQKNGAHGVTPHEVLFLGTPTTLAYAAMHKRLKEADRP
jgi:hypothetical protein